MLTTDAQSTTARIRLAQFSVDAQVVSLLVDDRETRIQGVGYGEFSDWYRLPAGEYTFHIVIDSDPDEIIVEETFQLGGGEWWTLNLIGSSERETLTLHPLIEDFSELTIGETRFNVFHAAEGTQTLDVMLNDNALFQFVNYPGTFTSVNGRRNDGRVRADIVANVYDIRIRANNNPDNILLDIGALQLNPDTYNFIALIGVSDSLNYVVASITADELLDAASESLLLDDSVVGEQTGQVRVAHLSSGTPTVDVFINGERSSLLGVGFAEVTEFVELPTGQHRVDITPAGLSQDDAVVEPIEIMVSADSWTTLAMIGTLSNDTLRVQPFVEDLSDLSETEVRLGVFQALPGSGPMNVQLGDDVDLIRLLGYPGSQGNNDGFSAVNLVNGVYTVRVVAAANPSDVIVELSNVNLGGGRSYLLAVILADPPYLLTFTDVVAANDAEDENPSEENSSEGQNRIDRDILRFGERR